MLIARWPKIGSKANASNDTVSYTYANRLRTGLSLNSQPSAFNISYGYNVTRRLTNVTSQAGAFGYAYGAPSTASALVDAITLPNGAKITNTYDNVARLLSTKLLNSSSSILDSESYSYNLAGQRTAETNTAGDFRNYTYDNIGELKTAIGKESGGTTNRWQEQLGYVYDAAGNLNYRTNNGLRGAFNVNNLNELTTVTNGGKLTVAGTTTTPATSVTVNTSNAVRYADSTFAATNMPLINGTNTFTAIGQDSYGHSSTNVSICYLPTTNSFSYDLNGNLLSDTNRNFAYDDENQLISVWVANTWSNSFVYDGKFRRRIERDYIYLPSSSSYLLTNEVHFIYDGNFVIQERNGSNIPQVTYTRSGSSLLARTDYGQEIPGSPTTAYYHLDGNANVTMLIYANQIVAAKYLYGPFGETLSLSGPLAPLNTYRFASKEWNDRAGIYYFGRRYYDPIIMRFLNRDPIAEQGGINLYAYVANNPINKIDPLGLLDNPITSTLPGLSGSWNYDPYGPAGPGYGPGYLYQPGCPGNSDNPFTDAWNFMMQHGSIDLTFNLSNPYDLDGLFYNLELNSEGLFYQTGVGRGLGEGVAGTLNLNFGNSSGAPNVATSISGGDEFGGSATYQVSPSGGSLSLGIGGGLGVGRTVTTATPQIPIYRFP